ncbi:tetratricopeptide repeat protein [Kitasatospora sp. NPDC058965]|uniref:tetratricopeptide repeat protein n=1 Tax=Kitasatospora sp. NPDC058965 TaxID=3346682 RepID=UPI0036999E1F
MFAGLRDRAAHKRDLRRAQGLRVTGDQFVAKAQWAPAEQAFREAVELRCARLGAQDPLSLEARGRRAAVLVRLGRREEAAAELRELVALCPDVLGQEHPVTGKVRIDLAALLLARNDPDGAAELALAVLRHRPAPDKLGLLAWDIKVRARGAQGRHREAADEGAALRSACAQVFGQDSVRTLKAGSDRAQSLVFLGEYGLAERECRELLDRHSSVDLLWLAVMNALVRALDGQGRHDGAQAAARAAITQQAQVTQPSGDVLITLQLGLARSLTAVGRHQEALQAVDRARAEFRRTPDARAGLAAPIATVAAQALLGGQRPQEAEVESRQAVELAEAHYAPIHYCALEATTALACAIAAAGRRTEAEQHLARCAAAWREHFGPHHPRTLATETELAALRRS